MTTRKKILTVVGARPQFVKAAALSRELLKHPELEEKIIHTGQHFDDSMSKVFFEEMDIPEPHFRFNINSMTHGAMTGTMLIEIEKVLIAENPDLVLLYGDTNSTLAGVLAARKLNFKIAHVESGLRFFDNTIPEEVNRLVADRLSDILFCPTQTAVDNLIKEGYEQYGIDIVRTGDIMCDTVFYYRQKMRQQTFPELETMIGNDPFVLLTCHRDNSTKEENLPKVVNAINKIAAAIKVIFPVHPRTKKKLSEWNLKLSDNVILIEPQGYFSMLYLLEKCQTVVSDSGGLQKEAYLMGKKCLFLHPFTPWVELVENGFVTCTSLEESEIWNQYQAMLLVNPDFSIQLYGDGTSAKTITDYICLYLNPTPHV